MKSHSNTRGLTGLAAIFASLLVTCFTACEKPAAPLKPMFEVTPFTLTERSGQPFDSKSMRGKVWVCSFFFASCPGVCLAQNETVAALHKQLAGIPEARILSISTDEADTPEVLTKYAAERGADDRWLFVTGKKDYVFDVSIKGFKLALADAPGVNAKERFIHSSKLALVDKNGWIRGYYDSFGDTKDAEMARLLSDIKRLVAEP